MRSLCWTEAADVTVEWSIVRSQPGRLLLWAIWERCSSGSARFIVVLGLVIILAGKLNLPIGRLPGDFTWRGKNTTVYFPLMTSIVLSVVLSLVLYFVNRMR